jgi:hypothetical protein
MAINNNKLSGPGIQDVSNNVTDSHSKIYIYSFSTNRTFSFNAFLTDFTDSFKSNWTSQEIYGRMDPIVTFKNTYRRINCSVDVPSFSVEEAEYNLYNVDGLIQSLYPVYTKNNLGTATLSSPPLFRVLFSNFIFNKSTKSPEYELEGKFLSNGLLSYFEGFDFSPNVENGFFIKKGDKNSLVPKLLKVTFSLGIIHEFPLGNEVNIEGKINQRSEGSFHFSTSEQALSASVERVRAANIAKTDKDTKDPALLDLEAQ